MMFCSIVPFKKQNYLLLWKVISKKLENFFVSGVIIYDQKKGLTVQWICQYYHVYNELQKSKLVAMYLCNNISYTLSTKFKLGRWHPGDNCK